MTTPKDKLPAHLKTAAAAVTKLAPWPTQQKVNDLADELDRLYPINEAMLKLSERLETAPNYLTRKMIVQEAETLIERLAIRGWRSGSDERLQKDWDACNPESWWPEDRDSPTYSQVAKMITVLMGSFPTSKIPEPEIFVHALMDDVMALDPSFVEMESTCRELRKTNKFMPTISEVIEELEKQQKLWSRRRSPLLFLEDNYNDLRAEIASFKETAPEEERKAKEEEAARIAARKAAEEARLAKEKAIAERKAAKSQPIVVGDRVRNCRGGAGTVVGVVAAEFERDGYRVRFENLDREYDLWSSQLERLIPGDEGFELPDVPMIEHRKEVPMAPIDTPDTVKLKNNYDDEF